MTHKHILDTAASKTWVNHLVRSKTVNTRKWWDVVDGFALTLVRLGLI